MKNMKTKKVGDKVYMDCDSSFGASSTGFFKIEEVKYKHDEDTGEKYPIYRLEDDEDWFDGRTGFPYNDDHSAYYLNFDISGDKSINDEELDMSNTIDINFGDDDK